MTALRIGMEKPMKGMDYIMRTLSMNLKVRSLISGTYAFQIECCRPKD